MESDDTAARPDALLDTDGPGDGPDGSSGDGSGGGSGGGMGADAFEAFNAMQATKARHFAMLERLDAKRERYGLDPTTAERTRLAGLLADHDAQVSRFTRAGRALKAADADAHRRLFVYIGAITTDAAANEDHGPTH